MYNAQDLFDKVIEQESTNPCILVAPQCSADSNWNDLSDMIDGVVNDIQNQYSVNSEKIYIAGYSEGTDGCYKVASDNPDKYAGIIAIAGKGDATSAQAIAKNNTGVMIFSGSEDCGKMIFDIEEQDVHAGGSGCGCCGSVFCGYVYRELKRHNLSKVLVMATGALMNPMIIEQGESIPAIAHAVAIEI